MHRGYRLGASIVLAPNDKGAGVPRSKDPHHSWCEVRAGTHRRGSCADASPLLTLSLTSCQRDVVKCLIMPKASYTSQLSTSLPSALRLMTIPATVTRLPVGGRP